MNKFLKNKKKEDGQVPPTPAPASSKKLFGRNKKPEPAPMPQVDLNITLPSSDDFRTSLIMPNLSARFSMLRDQDNPASLIGKASDDSVLAPRRRSRLGLAEFSGSNLGDIAEIESIRSSFRPPFAEDSRADSYHSADNTDDEGSNAGGSIMSRARPGEGNMLFGGRQKIYRIPVGDAASVTNLGANDRPGMKGRALYEDDVQLSAFQKYREEQRRQERQRQERERKLADYEREMQHDDSPKDSLYSPALSAYDEKRATTSSTNSGPSMASTAATSIASHAPGNATSPVFPSATTPTTIQRSNSRRLYDQNLDRHLNEQHNEKLTRLNSLSRKPSNSRPRLNHSKSATTLRDRYDLGSESQNRAASPQLPTSESLTAIDADRSSEPGNQSAQFNFGFGNLPDVAENPLVQAVDKQDRGKATALGQFNRPRQFNEEQFLSRQRSLARQRNNSRQRRPTGSQSPHVPDSGVTSPAHSGQTSATGSRRPSGEGRSTSALRGNSPAATRPRAGTIHNERSSSLSYRRDGQSPEDHARSGSGSSHSSRKQPPAPLQPESLQHPASLPTLEPSKSNETRLSPVVDDTPSKISFERGTEDDVPAPLQAVSPPSQASPPPLQDHPAMRIGSPERPSAEKRRGWSPEDLAGKFSFSAPSVETTMEVPSIDVESSSPQHPLAPGPHNGLRLGGFVREHLRQASNVSSVYDLDDREPMAADHTRGASVMFTPSQNLPWHEGQPLGRLGEDDQLAVSPRTGKPVYQPSMAPPVPPMPQVAAGAVRTEQASVQPQQATAPEEPTSPALGSPRSEFNPQNLKASDAAQWIDELKKQHTQQQQHTREISTETIQERRAFAEDLRQRQKAIQENLRIKNENNSRNASPVAASSKGFETSFNPFGLMRKSSTKDSGRRDGKARQSNGPPSGHNEPLPSPSKPPGRTLHMKMAGGEDNGFEITGPSQLRPESVATRSTLADSERPSTSRDESNTTRSSSASGLSGRVEDEKESMDVHRRDFPSTFPSTHPTANPSVDMGRARSHSSAASRPPVPPLPADTAAAQPVRAVASDAQPKAGRSATTSPANSAKGTPQLSSASSMTEMRAPASSSSNHAPSPLNASRAASPAVSANTPYTFPNRNPTERQAVPLRKRSPSIKKSAISQPTLVSSTSNFETVDLAEKRAAMGRGKVAAFAAEINATSAATGEKWTPNEAAGKPPSVPPMVPLTPARTKGFFQRRTPEPTSPKLSEKDAVHDDFMTRPDSGRMRVRAVSDAKGFGRRYEATPVNEDNGVQGGMF